MGLFWRSRRGPTWEDQLAELAKLGIHRNPGVEDADLCTFASREDHERRSYRGLAEAMGMDLEREPWTPIADRLWMCDVERIEDHGDYRRVVERLERMTGAALGLTDIRDRVVVEPEGQEPAEPQEPYAWVSFSHAGKTVKWDLLVDDDYLDTSVWTRYDALLRRAKSPVRVYLNATDYGQVALLAAFTAEQARRFTKLTGIRMDALSVLRR